MIKNKPLRVLSGAMRHYRPLGINREAAANLAPSAS